MCPPPAAAANPRLSQDYQAIMEWLSSEASEGLAFHSSVTFDPPVELSAGGVGLDANLGVGTIPVHKNTFPRLQVQTLQDLRPQDNFLSQTPFPDMTAHLRLGLPNRYEAALRLSDATIPRHKISPTTEGQGQSNIFGVELRKHFGDARTERVTTYLTYDYLQGGFKFFNGFRNIPVTDTLSLDADNEGLLAWNIQTYGLGLSVSHQFGPWVPYYGFAYHYSHGFVRTRLESRFETPLVAPIVGKGRHPVEGSQQLRLILGTMKKGRRVGLYATTEVLAFGSRAGRAFAAHLGFALPLWGSSSGALPSNLPPDLKDAPRSEEARPLPSVIILR